MPNTDAEGTEASMSVLPNRDAWMTRGPPPAAHATAGRRPLTTVRIGSSRSSGCTVRRGCDTRPTRIFGPLSGVGAAASARGGEGAEIEVLAPGGDVAVAGDLEHAHDRQVDRATV